MDRGVPPYIELSTAQCTVVRVFRPSALQHEVGRTLLRVSAFAVGTLSDLRTERESADVEPDGYTPDIRHAAP